MHLALLWALLLVPAPRMKGEVVLTRTRKIVFPKCLFSQGEAGRVHWLKHNPGIRFESSF